MVLWWCSIHEIALFGGFFGPYLTQLLLDFVEIFTRVSIQGDTNSVWTILEKFKFLQKREIPKVCTFGPTLTLLLPLKMAKWGKIIKLRRKFSHQAIQICKRQNRISSPLQMKNRINFCTFWAFYWENLGVVKG